MLLLLLQRQTLESTAAAAAAYLLLLLLPLSCFGSFHYSCMWHVAVVVAAVGGCCTIWVLLVAVGWLTVGAAAGL